MKIEVYGKEGCKICASAKDKLKRMGLPFTEHSLAEKTALHEGWRTDNTIDVMVKHVALNLGMPVILIDGKAFSYPEAMRKLRNGTDRERAAVRTSG